MHQFFKLLFMITLLMGTMIAISSYSWLSVWISLEINLLSIIPLLSDSKNLYPSESALKYFIMQAMASTILLFSIVCSINTHEIFSFNQTPIMLMIMDSALLTKMGAAPFHAWFPEVMDGLSWMNSLIMLTWQKLTPMVVFMYMTKSTLFISSSIIFSSMIGGILGLNQVSLRKIMAYSSINHIGWMISSMLNSQTIWLIYFLIYSIISTSIIVIFHILNIFYLKQLFNSLNSNKIFKFFFILNFLSLGGLPPFLGFFPKWLTINNLVLNNFLTISVILIISTLVTLFFYLGITFSTMVINSKEMIAQKTSYNTSLVIFLNTISLAGLVACTLIAEMT